MHPSTAKRSPFTTTTDAGGGSTVALAAAAGIAFLVSLLVRIDALGTLGYFQWSWPKRIAAFWSALVAGRFAATYQSPHPGVMLMWVLGAVRTLVARSIGLRDAVVELWWLELAQVLWVSALMAAIVIVLRQTLVAYGMDARRALCLGLLPVLWVTLDPMFLTLTQVLSLDGPLAAQLVLAILIFLWARRSSSSLGHACAGAAMALAVLTKTPGLIVVATMAVWIFVGGSRAAGEIGVARALVRPARAFAAAFAVAFVLAWPAMWVAPARTLQRLVMTDQEAAQIRSGDLRSLLSAGNVAGRDALLDVVLHPHTVGDTRLIYGRTHSAWEYYAVVIFFKMPPLTLLTLICFLAIVVAPSRRRGDPALRLAFHVLIFALVYLVVMTIAAKKTWRYMVTCTVLLELVAGLAFAWICEQAWRRRARLAVVALAAVAIAQLAAIVAHRPHYIVFSNPLGGGRSGAERYLNLYWGEGTGEAARYLRERAAGRPIRFFTAVPLVARDLKHGLPEARRERDPEHAEFVIVTRREMLAPSHGSVAERYAQTRAPEHVVTIGAEPYLWIYRVE
ncbi:MAG TPA: hypothetical protein VEI94_12070 [Candidatus Bathyarchaeia archaeon]|nr:hypothetical protein [Candidatus Bathyarchaeia archaeon]